MINAKLTKRFDRYCLDVCGHAETKESEKICSAASALFCTLLDVLTDLEERKKIVNLASNTAPGNSHIEFELCADRFFDGEKEISDYEEIGLCEGEIVLFAFLRGFELLSGRYPSSVACVEGPLI